MRLSVNTNDPGYHQLATLCSVLLNGKPVEDCITADDTAGEVVVHRRIRNKIVIENGEIAVKTLRGRVQIVVPNHLRKYIFGA